jgi:hypothetical protein
LKKKEVTNMKIYIASSWKNQHAVMMMTEILRNLGHEVLSFVENNHGEQDGHKATEEGKPMGLDEWVWSIRGEKSFKYDTEAAMESDAVIYIGPSGCDAWAECGCAYARGVPIFALQSKGEQVGLMRRLARWFSTYPDLLTALDEFDHERKRELRLAEAEREHAEQNGHA